MSPRRVVAVLAVAAAVGVSALAVSRWSGDAEAAALSAESEAASVHETATVRRGSLSTERDFSAAVSFGDEWTIGTAASGTVTQSHPTGSVVGFGDEIARVDDKPITLAEGSMPMYRELFKVDTRSRDENGDRVKLMIGSDVEQLQRFLISEGFDADESLEVDGVFGGTTQRAVKAWQEAVGLSATGRVDNTQLLFESDPIRLASTSRVGDQFSGLRATAAESLVLVDTSTRDRSALPVGASVEVDINGQTFAATVTGQKQVTSDDGSAIWRTTVDTGDAVDGETTAATVSVVQIVADDVLLVPVGALLALGEGGFALEVPTGDSTRLIPVEVGEVLDGFAEVRGDIATGDTVLVAT
jgi:hypothetical protein